MKPRLPFVEVLSCSLAGQEEKHEILWSLVSSCHGIDVIAGNGETNVSLTTIRSRVVVREG